jgi:hypothetical protein
VSAVDAFQTLAIAAKERQASLKLHPARPFMPPYREQIRLHNSVDPRVSREISK